MFNLRKLMAVLGVAASVAPGGWVAAAAHAASKTTPAQEVVGFYEVDNRSKEPDDKAGCIVRWTLRADGTFLIENGEARIEGQYVLVEHEHHLWLDMSDETTNGLAGCNGKVPQANAHGIAYFYFNQAGGLVLTTPSEDENGAPAIPALVGILKRVQ